MELYVLAALFAFFAMGASVLAVAAIGVVVAVQLRKRTASAGNSLESDLAALEFDSIVIDDSYDAVARSMRMPVDTPVWNRDGARLERVAATLPIPEAPPGLEPIPGVEPTAVMFGGVQTHNPTMSA